MSIVEEVAAGVPVGPRGLEQELLQADAAAEALARGLQGWRLAGLLDAFELGRQEARRLEHGRGDGVVGHVHGRRLGPAGAEDLQFAARRVPPLADGLGLDLGVLARADPPDRGDARGLGQGLGADCGRARGSRIAAGRHGVGLAATPSTAALLGGDRSAGAAVGPEVDEADLAERRLADDVDRAGELLAVDRRLLRLLDELELLDAGADGRLPGEAVPRGGDHLAGRRSVTGDHARGDELPPFDLDRVGVAHASRRVVREPDRPVLRRHRQPRQVQDDGVAPPGDAHGPARVRDHLEAR